MFKIPRRLLVWTLPLAAVVAVPSSLSARKMMWDGPMMGGNLSLPQILRDNHGVSWDIQQDGSIGDGGMDLYDGGGHLYLDGQFHFQSNGMGSVDPATNEIVLGPMQFKGMNVSRRIAVNKERGFCRWAEVIENPTANKVNLSMRVYFNMGGMIAITQPFHEEKGAKQVIGMALGDQRHNYGVIVAGRGAKFIPKIQPQQGNDQLNLVFDVEVPPRQTVVVVHVQIYRRLLNLANEALSEIKDKEYLAQLPKELQKRVINFRVTDKSIGDADVLRGDVLDVVELRGGDLLRGALREPIYKIHTHFGDIELAAERIIGILNTGAYKPRQLLVTTDGQVIGGQLAKPTISLQLTNGQIQEIPLAAMTRVGYRKRSGEPDEWKLDQTMVYLRSGDRMQVHAPAEPISVSTRYGRLSLNPSYIAALTFASEENAAHRVVLSDGSQFAALVNADVFRLNVNLDGESSTPMTLPAASISRLQLRPTGEGPDDSTPSMSLSNGDLLVASLQGTLQLEMTFDTLTLSAGEIKRLAYAGNGPADVEIELWDESVVQGQLRDPLLTCITESGVSLRVPASLVEEYLQPRPQPSDMVTRTIEELVAELSASDWKRRDAAQQRLAALGPVAISTLQRLRDSQMPEAQQRIDLVLPLLEKMSRQDRRAP